MKEQDFFKKNAPLIVTLVVCICAVCTIYSNTLNVEFVFDDIPMIMENDSVRMESPTFDSVFTSMKSTRPVPMLSFAINYYFHGYSVQGYHLVNIIIHIVNSILIFFLISKLLSIAGYKDGWERRWLPVITACIWAVSPVHVQSVTYIVQRMTSMATMFYIASFLCYLTARTSTKKQTATILYVLSFLTGILSILSKEISITLPFFIIFYEWLFFRDADIKIFKKYIFIVAGFSLFAGVTGFFVFKTVYSKFIADGYSIYNFDIIQRCLTEFRVVIYYIGLLLFPHPSRLNLDYDFTVSNSIFDPATTLIAILIVIASLTGAAYSIFSPPHGGEEATKHKKSKLIAFCILWYFGNLVIESSFIPLDLVFEHRTYLPSALLFLMIIVVLTTVLKNRPLIVSTLLICMVICSYWTMDRNKDWRTGVSIWTDTASKSPAALRPYYNIGSSYEHKREYGKAYEYYIKALSKNPTPESLGKIYIAIGRYFYRLGEYTTSLGYYKKARDLKPDDIGANAGVGAVLVKLKKYKPALEVLNEVLKRKPSDVQAHANIGEIYLGQQKLEKALEHYNIVLKLKDENAGYYYNRGIVYKNMGRTELAIKDFNKSVLLDKAFAPPLIELGKIYTDSGNYDEGILNFQQAENINPESIDCHANWAFLLVKTGKIEDAIYHFKRIIEIDPENISAYRNVGKLHYTNNEYSKSLENWEKIVILRPQDLIAMDNIALCYMAEKKFSKAVNIYQKMLKIHPENLSVWYNLACAYSVSGKLKESVATLKNAISKGFSDIDYMKKDPDLSNVMKSEIGRKLLYDIEAAGIFFH